MVPDGAGLGWVPDGPHPSTRILAVTHVQDFAEARRDPLVHGAQSQVEEVRRQGTALRDSFGGLDGTHRALRIRDVQIVRPIVEGPDKRPMLREAVGSCCSPGLVSSSLGEQASVPHALLASRSLVPLTLCALSGFGLSEP